MKNKTGFTIVEVMVAVVVLGAAIIGVMAMLRTGDRIKAHQTQLAMAAGLAQNEAERIKYIAKNAINIPDTTYEQTINGLTFSVLRTVIKSDTIEDGLASKAQEIEIAIIFNGGMDTLSKFRLIQGYF
jgi:Tfp pilus assembly protein PilV